MSVNLKTGFASGKTLEITMIYTVRFTEYLGHGGALSYKIRAFLGKTMKGIIEVLLRILRIISVQNGL